MQLNYRGLVYVCPAEALETVQTGFGQFLGTLYPIQQSKSLLAAQPAHSLKYRGAAYSGR